MFRQPSRLLPREDLQTAGASSEAPAAEHWYLAPVMAESPRGGHRWASSTRPDQLEPCKRAKLTREAGRADAVNTGVVARADTVDSFETAARRDSVKGAIFQRGAHCLETQMARWVAEQEEPLESFAMETLCLHSASSSAASDKVTTWAVADVSAACTRVTAGLPETFRDAVRSDAESISALLLRLCPAAHCLTLHVDIIGFNACQRWHEDNYIGRATITYCGPGTWMVDDASVQYDQFKTTVGFPTEKSDPLIVPRFEDIHRAPANGVALIKGKQWPGIRGSGLIHKSPNVPYENGRPVLKRLLLKVDLSNEHH